MTGCFAWPRSTVMRSPAAYENAAAKQKNTADRSHILAPFKKVSVVLNRAR